MVRPEKAGATTSHPDDVDILNFALNLEYLEAEFCTKATSGKYINEAPYNIAISGVGDEGPTTGGKQVNLGANKVIFTDQVAAQIAVDERDHVKLLRSALGGAAIAKPEINLDAAGFGFATGRDFLKLARMFEDIGVSAYAGAAPLIASKNTLEWPLESWLSKRNTRGTSGYRSRILTLPQSRWTV